MIITFCGNSDILDRSILLDKVFSVIQERCESENILFYLGGYGDFDAIAFTACKKYQIGHPSARLIFVSPYLSETYLRRRGISLKQYDEILYPDIESSFPRFAILKRNQWMIDQSDLIIAYVRYGWGGAAKSLKYALSKGKECLNLADN